MNKIAGQILLPLHQGASMKLLQIYADVARDDIFPFIWGALSVLIVKAKPKHLLHTKISHILSYTESIWLIFVYYVLTLG